MAAVARAAGAAGGSWEVAGAWGAATTALAVGARALVVVVTASAAGKKVMAVGDRVLAIVDNA